VLYKFRDTCEKKFLQEITRHDCLGFMRHLYALGNEARTVFNRMGIVQQLLRLHGITGLLQGRDKPKFVANVRKMYGPEELEALFKSCTPDEKILYLFFLLTGERDKEIRHTAWTDIDFTRKCVRVTAKKQLGFKPKDKEEREIPVPSSLLTALKEYKARQSGSNPHNLVFPTGGGRPDRKFEKQAQENRPPRRPQLWSLRIPARQQVLRRSALQPMVPSQIPPHLCDGIAGERSKHSCASGMAWPQRPGFNHGLSQVCRPQRHS